MVRRILEAPDHIGFNSPQTTLAGASCCQNHSGGNLDKFGIYSR